MRLHGFVPSEDLSWSFLRSYSSLLCQSHWLLLSKLQKVPLSLLLAFQVWCSWVCASVHVWIFVPSLQECSMTPCTISGCSGVCNLHSNSLPLGSVSLSPFISAALCLLNLHYCSPNVSCVNERPCCPRSVVLGGGGQELFIFFCCLHTIWFFFNSDQYNIC